MKSKVFAYTVCGHQAVYPREIRIHENQIRQHALCQAHRLFAIFRFDDAITAQFQYTTIQVARVVVIFNQQDERLRSPLSISQGWRDNLVIRIAR